MHDLMEVSKRFLNLFKHTQVVENKLWYVIASTLFASSRMKIFEKELDVRL